jgi:Protein of unknown function (DUF1648)
MNRKVFQVFIWLMWLALPLTAFRFWAAWNHLPLRMATHFDVNWQPNGWMPLDGAFHFALGITAFVLVVFTVISYVAHKTHAPQAFSWALLGFFYLVVGFVCAVNSGVVQYNVNGQRVGIDLWTVLLPVAVLALTVIFLGAKRGASLPAAIPIFEETHGSRAWSLLFFALLLAQSAAVFAIPAAPVRFASILLGLLFALIALHIWTGFQYVFTSAGLEIRTLGFRLQSIPREEIQTYSVEPWNLLRGYGIRGIGKRRAYVWCNTGVRIRTTNGEVFLGHEQPERIVHDLDSITLGHAGQISQG